MDIKKINAFFKSKNSKYILNFLNFYTNLNYLLFHNIFPILIKIKI